MATVRAERLARKNVIVDAAKVSRLRRTLALEEAVAALERLRRRGTWGKRLAS